jgi:hypothetical protein
MWAIGARKIQPGYYVIPSVIVVYGTVGWMILCVPDTNGIKRISL